MCALTAGKRGKSVLLLERNKKPGAKILISGGGRCNFTNQDVTAAAYLSQNPHFAKSALSRYTPWDFMDLLQGHGLTWHEKTLGQLFCDQGAGRILDVLLQECQKAGVELRTSVDIEACSAEPEGFWLKSNIGDLTAEKLVMASGGISIPKMGATGFAYDIARQFGANIVTPEPALVPFVFDGDTVDAMKALAGVSADSIISCDTMSFRENLLFTHRGLSGPAVLQISSYWQEGQEIVINLLPDIDDCLEWLKREREAKPKAKLKTVLATKLADRLADWLAAGSEKNMADYSNAILDEIAQRLSAWRITPAGTEGFKKAEVTRGGVSTHSLSSKTMEMKHQKGLYFIGECVDVTGWLGGYNFQWAWASGYACGQSL